MSAHPGSLTLAEGIVEVQRDLVPLIEVERRRLLRRLGGGPRDVALRVRHRARCPARTTGCRPSAPAMWLTRRSVNPKSTPLMRGEVLVPVRRERCSGTTRWSAICDQVLHVLVVGGDVELGVVADLVRDARPRTRWSARASGSDCRSRRSSRPCCDLVLEEVVRDVQVLQVGLLEELAPVDVHDHLVRHREADAQSRTQAAVGLVRDRGPAGVSTPSRPERWTLARQRARVGVDVVVARPRRSRPGRRARTCPARRPRTSWACAGHRYHGLTSPVAVRSRSRSDRCPDVRRVLDREVVLVETQLVPVAFESALELVEGIPSGDVTSPANA